MRYISPIALPDGLGEWLGTELEARGVESASLYARAVLSILLHSEMEPELELDAAEPPEAWSRRAAIELQLKLERQRDKEPKRGRPRYKQQLLRNKSHARPVLKKELPVISSGFQEGIRRRPHSWSGDEEELKKAAAIECLLTATDEQWPVEKLVDELYARVKLLQLEGNDNTKWTRVMGSSAPVYSASKGEPLDGTTLDSDSFTSVSSPEAEAENYFSAFPPLDISSPCEENDQAPPLTVWAVPLQRLAVSPVAGEDHSRVPFLRVRGTRLSPREGNACASVLCDTSEAYFGDCSSRESSLERPLPSLPEEELDACCSKGRLYQRGAAKVEWEDWVAGEDTHNIWAPHHNDWNLLGQHAFCSDLALEKLSGEAVHAVQQSLAVLNHNPNVSSFAEVVPGLKYLGSSKLAEWMGAVKRKILEQQENSRSSRPVEDNLLVSPKTHFCPIQEEGESEVCVKDGATFNVDAKLDPVHFLRSPSGALYLPENEENLESGWGGWTKYMVYNPPSPPLEEETELFADARAASPFPLKFRVLQTEKYCQTEVLAEDSVEELQQSSAASFQACGMLLNSDDLWKFDAQVLKEVGNPKAEAKLPDVEEGSAEEEEEGLLKEVFNFTAEAPPTCKDSGQDAAEADLDELWNPLMAEGEGYDVCEWVPQDAYEGEEFAAEDEGEWPEAWAESWPPPHIPVEYLDDEFFDEIFGSLDSKASNPEAKTSSSKKSCRRRRKNSQKGQPQQQHRKRPCSFFVEGECLRPDCKFSHDLGTIPCRFWLESSCFKGDACPFMHAKPATKTRGRRRSYSHSDVDATEGGSIQRVVRSGAVPKPDFELDLENDFPSLSQAADCKLRKSNPIPINFATADVTGSSAEGPASSSAKRRRRKPAAQRQSAVVVLPTSSDSSPCVKKTHKNVKKSSERRRTVSEQGDGRPCRSPNSKEG